jgi:hypothetical protein
MTSAKPLDIQKLKEVFEYKDGALYYKTNPNRSVSRIGTRAGWKSDGRPYRMVIHDHEEYREHRIIWCLHFGAIPDGYVIDHIDGDPCNNLIHNLRAVPETVNRLNQRMRSNSKSPYKGVCWDKERKKWMARLRVNKTQYNLGRFDTAEEAAKAYDAKVREVCPGDATVNFPLTGERSVHTGEINNGFPALANA